MSGTATPTDGLRRPFLVAALVTAVLALLVCLGSPLASRPPSFESRRDSALANPQTSVLLADYDLEPVDAEEALKGADPDDPPGLGVPALALIGTLLVLVLSLTTAPLLLGDRVTGLVQGIVSLVGGVLALLASIAVALVALAALLTMVGLVLAAPFGTLAYLAVFGSFPTGAAALLVGLVLALQLGTVVLLVFAHQRFLASKGLMLLLATAVLLTFVTGLLHAIVPGFLVSIADAVAALISAVVAAVWSLLIAIGGLVGVLKLLQLNRQGGGGSITREAGQTSRSTHGGPATGQVTWSTEPSS